MNDKSEELRKAMRQWTTGVCVVCGRNETFRHGMTVNSFTSVSLDPPLIVITLAKETRTWKLVRETGRFSVSILRHNQKSIADRFSGKDDEETDRFTGIETRDLPGGLPVISGCLAVLESKVVNNVDFENSTMFIADITSSEVQVQGKPLVYHNREYYSL
jgi:flavin reductase (DIM6/NTAB) family NADH-FMN oxidoreductase RutF